jgi:hypothetical protein
MNILTFVHNLIEHYIFLRISIFYLNHFLQTKISAYN